MRLLLDTRVFLWWRANSPRLGTSVREAVATADVAYVSAASIWEMAIKIALGRLRVPGPLEAAVSDSGFEPLPISLAHAEHVATLPMHHRDPFDRMLVAQAQAESLTLVTADRSLEPYDIDRITV